MSLDVIAAYPEIKHWITGEHSPGRSMAANDKIQNSLKNLPADSQVLLIEVGNHAQYGNYLPLITRGAP